MDGTNDQKLKAVIAALLASSAGSSDREIAASVTREEPDLVVAWAAEKLGALIRAERKRRKIPDAAQMAFPFHDLSIQIRTRTGPVELRNATMGVLREAELVMRRKQRAAIADPRPNSMLGKLRREIEVMEPWVYADRKITVEEVHKRLAAGTAPPVIQRSKMSEAMRRYWDSKTPEERSAIWRARIRKRKKSST